MLIPALLVGFSAMALGQSIVDRVQLADPGSVRLGGLLGERYSANAQGRLLAVDEDEMLAGYRHRPGKQAWIGEHVGKWLDAAATTYETTKDPALLAKMHRVEQALEATQEPDGYLGTYALGRRLGIYGDDGWDVWTHSYNIIGLLAYYRATGEVSALNTARRAADLLVKTFGGHAKSFNEAGFHTGMAATSVMVPLIDLYQLTHDSAYLDLVHRCIDAHEEKGGSHLIQDLLVKGSVAETGNGKAYEMLTNIQGLLKLYRLTGDASYLKPAKIAWADIVKNRLYITGTGSAGEYWTKNGQWPDDEACALGETCVTVTWIQVNAELLKLTGDSNYADQIETSIYNHLLASQSADGLAWCYYDPLTGVRHPSPNTTCCLSSGPRAVALMPTLAYATRPNGVDVNLFGDSSFEGSLGIKQTSSYPFGESVRLEITRGGGRKVSLRVRIPAWAHGATASLQDHALDVKPGKYLVLNRRWKVGETVELQLPMPLETVHGSGSNKGLVAYRKGPLVYAACIPGDAYAKGQEMVSVFGSPRAEGDDLMVDGAFSDGKNVSAKTQIKLKPFYRAGDKETPYRVWVQQK